MLSVLADTVGGDPGGRLKERTRMVWGTIWPHKGSASFWLTLILV